MNKIRTSPNQTITPHNPYPFLRFARGPLLPFLWSAPCPGRLILLSLHSLDPKMTQAQGAVVAYGVATKQRPLAGMVVDWSAAGEHTLRAGASGVARAR